MRASRYRVLLQRPTHSVRPPSSSSLKSAALVCLLLHVLPVTPRPIPAPEDCLDTDLEEINKQFEETAALNVGPEYKDNQHINPELWNKLIDLHRKLPEGKLKENYPRLLRVLLTALKEANKTDINSTRPTFQGMFIVLGSNERVTDGTSSNVPFIRSEEMQDSTEKEETLSYAHSDDNFVMSVTPPHNATIDHSMIKSFPWKAVTVTPYIMSVKDEVMYEPAPRESERLSAHSDETDIKTLHVLTDEIGLDLKLKTENSSYLPEKSSFQLSTTIAYTPLIFTSSKPNYTNVIVASTSNPILSTESIGYNTHYPNPTNTENGNIGMVPVTIKETVDSWKSGINKNVTNFDERTLNSSSFTERNVSDSFTPPTTVVSFEKKIANIDLMKELTPTPGYEKNYTAAHFSSVSLGGNIPGVFNETIITDANLLEELPPTPGYRENYTSTHASGESLVGNIPGVFNETIITDANLMEELSTTPGYGENYTSTHDSGESLGGNIPAAYDEKVITNASLTEELPITPSYEEIYTTTHDSGDLLGGNIPAAYDEKVITNASLTEELPITPSYEENYTTTHDSGVSLEESISHITVAEHTLTGITSAGISLQNTELKPSSEWKKDNVLSSSSPTTSNLYFGSEGTGSIIKSIVPEENQSQENKEFIDPTKFFNINTLTSPIITIVNDSAFNNFSANDDNEKRLHQTDLVTEKVRNFTENYTTTISLFGTEIHEVTKSDIQENEHSSVNNSEILPGARLMTSSSSVTWSSITRHYSSTNGHMNISSVDPSSIKRTFIETSSIEPPINLSATTLPVSHREETKSVETSTSSITSVYENRHENSKPSISMVHEPNDQTTINFTHSENNFSWPEIRPEKTKPPAILPVDHHTWLTPSVARSPKGPSTSLIIESNMIPSSSKTTTESEDYSLEGWTTFKVPARQKSVSMHDLLKLWPSLNYM